MLDVTVSRRQLTQGQPPAERILATPSVARAEVADESPAATAPPDTPAASPAPDIEALTRRVYDLMREDLAVHRERSHRRR